MTNPAYLSAITEAISAFKTMLKADANALTAYRHIQTPLVDVDQLRLLELEVNALRHLAIRLEHQRGMKSQTIAKLYKLTPGRISQIINTPAT